MPPKGKLSIGSNVGIDKEQAYRDKIADLQRHQVCEVPLVLIDEIENVRTNYDQEGIQRLAASIEKRGLLQPVILSEQGTRYGIQAGHRRVLAFRLLNRETIPALIRPSPEFLAEVQLIENIQREDLSPADLEAAVGALVTRHGSQEKVAQLLEKSKQWVSNVLAASKVRENLGTTLQQHDKKDSLPSGHLRDLAALPASDQVRAAKDALHNGGSKRAFRNAAKKVRGGTAAREAPRDSVRLLSFSLVVERSQDGRLALRPEIGGNASPEARSRFEAFCADIESLLASRSAEA